MRHNVAFGLVAVFIIIGGVLALFIKNNAKPKPIPTPTPSQVLSATPPMKNYQTWPDQPKLEIDKSKKYSAVLTTSEGEITISLNVVDTPITSNNFIFLAKNGFYNGTVFHRAMKNFMIQGGDPEGNGTGGPGYRFEDEPVKSSYSRGTVAMANAGPDTNGSQFFIMHKDYPLDPLYVIFGKITKGIEVVDKIAEASVTRNPMSGELSKPVNPVTVEKVEIIEE